tara:strand:+ start:84 stop:254 length:171 start_codon:yes stop_codon:yes gene_type:complete
MKKITSFNIVYTVYDDKTNTYSDHNVSEDFMKKARLKELEWYLDGIEEEFYKDEDE